MAEYPAVWCIYCRRAVHPGAVQCPSCGRALTDGERVIKCQSCGAFMVMSDAKCKNCGLDAQRQNSRAPPPVSTAGMPKRMFHLIVILFGSAMFLINGIPFGVIGLPAIAILSFRFFLERRDNGKSAAKPNPGHAPPAQPAKNNYESLNESLEVEAEMRRVDGLDGWSFERWFADLLQYHGYTDITVTQRSGDYGGDVTANKNGERFVFQCKRYTDNVGVKAVQEAHFAESIYDCQHSAVVSNREFSRSAVKGAAKTGVKLIGRKELAEMLREKSKALGFGSALWPNNRASAEINAKYFEGLPPVPKDGTSPEYVTAYALGGESRLYNPYSEPAAFQGERMMVELLAEFGSREEAERFAKVVEKKYFAIPQCVHHNSETYTVCAYAFGDIVRNSFDEEKCCFHLENWAH